MRSGNFRADDNNDNGWTALPLVHARGVMTMSPVVGKRSSIIVRTQESESDSQPIMTSLDAFITETNSTGAVQIL